MSDQKHTPGPWNRVDISTGSTPVKEQLCYMGYAAMQIQHDGSPEGHANADLIARAPVTKAERDELLEALKEMTAMADSLLTRVQKMDGSVKQAFKKSRAAIARAEKGE